MPPVFINSNTSQIKNIHNASSHGLLYTDRDKPRSTLWIFPHTQISHKLHCKDFWLEAVPSAVRVIKNWTWVARQELLLLYCNTTLLVSFSVYKRPLIQIYSRSDWVTQNRNFGITGRISFQSPNQQYQSTEGNQKHWHQPHNITRWTSSFLDSPTSCGGKQRSILYSGSLTPLRACNAQHICRECMSKK